MFIINREYLLSNDKELINYINENFLNNINYQIEITHNDIDEIINDSKVITALHFKLHIKDCNNIFFQENIHSHINDTDGCLLLITASSKYDMRFFSKLIEHTNLFNNVEDAALGIAYCKNIEEEIIDFKFLVSNK